MKPVVKNKPDKLRQLLALSLLIDPKKHVRIINAAKKQGISVVDYIFKKYVK